MREAIIELRIEVHYDYEISITPTIYEVLYLNGSSLGEVVCGDCFSEFMFEMSYVKDILNLIKTDFKTIVTTQDYRYYSEDEIDVKGEVEYVSTLKEYIDKYNLLDESDLCQYEGLLI